MAKLKEIGSYKWKEKNRPLSYLYLHSNLNSAICGQG